MDVRERRPTGPVASIAAVGAVGVAMCLTVLWWNMRRVLDVGGMCAEGGPYVIATPCPEGTAWMIGLSIPLGVVFATAWAVGLALLHPHAVRLAFLGWGALFGALGWNFLEYGIDPPGGGGPDAGLITCGVVFMLMALPALAVIPMAVRDAQDAGRRDLMAVAVTAAGAPIGVWLALLMVASAT